MLEKGIEPSSRRCGFQPVSRPERICSTEPDWITIMIDASAAEMTISISVDRTSRIAPPQPRRVGPSIRAATSPRILGASSTAIVNSNRRSARW